MKDLSVIIVNYRGWERLRRCLDSLNNIDDNRFSFEVVVVDNQSNDGKFSEFVKLYPQYNFVANSGNHGFANGCNLGASRSTGNCLLFLNPDTTVNSDALFEMLEEVRVRPANSIVSCRQVREDGSLDRPYGKFLSMFTLTGWQRAIKRVFEGKLENSFTETKHYLYPDWVSGSVLMIGRESFYRLGKWNEDFWMYFEDVDLCRRALLRNCEIVKLKSAQVGHIHGASSRINLETTVLTKTEVNISRHVYIAKHENAVNAFFMHLILILNSMVLGLFPALFGGLVFFIKPCRVITLKYLKLANYYLNVLKTGNWLSERSVNYSSGKVISEQEVFYSTGYNQLYHQQ